MCPRKIKKVRNKMNVHLHLLMGVFLLTSVVVIANPMNFELNDGDGTYEILHKCHMPRWTPNAK